MVHSGKWCLPATCTGGNQGPWEKSQCSGSHQLWSKHPSIFGTCNTVQFSFLYCWHTDNNLCGRGICCWKRSGDVPQGTGYLMEETRSIFQQVMSAVYSFYQRHVAHHDIKLENIIFDGASKVKLCDFGVATQLAEGKMLEDICSSLLY